MSEPSKYSADELESIALMERMMKEQEMAAVAMGEAYDPVGPATPTTRRTSMWLTRLG